ncbi:RapH N-terminal domain-containing protein [Bacillus sp. JCM 19041]|uniref:response regulator aspartate phosphatase n=1 Tax=Bacillus sp. JCM 19041 TaxID=1460637 RepID=UPI0006D1847E
MAPLLSPAEVGEKIVEWHSCIITRDLEQAHTLKEEVDQKVNRMKADDKMLSYYQLISYRHDILTETIHEESSLPAIDDSQTSTDDYLRFMYYYVSGQSEFFHGRYKSAIRLYVIAERLLENVNDAAEKAEFYERIGISYYYMDQYSTAASYVEQALTFFEKQESYIEREINCKSLLAAIETELERYESADLIYEELLVSSRPYPITHGHILRNMGLNRMSQGKFLEAASFSKNHWKWKSTATRLME